MTTAQREIPVNERLARVESDVESLVQGTADIRAEIRELRFVL